MNKKVVVGVAAVLVVAGIGIGTWFWVNQQPAEAQITAIMPFVAGGEWGHFYAAIDQGYYAAEGLKVDLAYTSEGSFGAIKQVAAGQAQFGYAGADSVILARSQGLPVVAVYQVEHHNRFSVITKKDSGITKPADLAGKTIAMPGPGSPPDIAAKAILKKAGVDLNTVTFVPVGSGLIPALTENRADAIAGYIIHELIIDSIGVPYNVWHAEEYATNYGGLSIITTEDTIKKNPDLVRRFVRATDKGLEYAIAHPAETIDAYIAKFNPEAKDFRDLELKYWQRLVNEVHDVKRFSRGQFTPQTWTTTMEVLLELGLISQRIDVTKAYRTDFLPQR